MCSEYGLEEGSCEHGNEPSGLIKGGDFDCNSYLLKEYPTGVLTCMLQQYCSSCFQSYHFL